MAMFREESILLALPEDGCSPDFGLEVDFESVRVTKIPRSVFRSSVLEFGTPRREKIKDLIFFYDHLQIS